MKQLLSNIFSTKRSILALHLAYLIVGLSVAFTIFQWWNNKPPEKAEVPIGFTWISPGVDQNGDPWGVVLEETDNLRVTYTTGMTVVQNKQESEPEPYMFSGGRWYFRAIPAKSFKVAVIEGDTLVTSFDDVMVVSNDPERCPDDQCPAGAVYMLDVNLKTFTVLTSARRYVVINP